MGRRSGGSSLGMSWGSEGRARRRKNAISLWAAAVRRRWSRLLERSMGHRLPAT
jgi:hypothetical protein